MKLNNLLNDEVVKWWNKTICKWWSLLNDEIKQFVKWWSC